MIVYISGAYTASTSDERNKNIQKAREVAIELWNNGFTALCPHLNTANFEEECNATYKDYLKGDLNLLARCDAVVMLVGWENSKGAYIEREYAEAAGIPISYYPDFPVKPKVEEHCPQQTEAFLSSIMSMYRVYLQKNYDYGTANILGTGYVGLITRLWDKMARLLNLSGFKLTVLESKYESPKTPKNESIDDNLGDLANYAIIGMILRKGLWGK